MNHNNWRSLLFIPANNSKFIEKASQRGADAIILDLEDSVPSEQKQQARKHVAQHINYLYKEGVELVVRINSDLFNATADLTTVINDKVSAIMLPKIIGADHISLIDQAISQLEQERAIETGKIKIIALIETIKALENCQAIASSSPRVIALALGSEDLSLDGGFEPTPENLTLPAQKIIYAARLANISAIGFAGSIAEFADLDLFSQRQRQARSMGFNGAMCIHPSQVDAINKAHTPTAEQIVQAKAIVSAYNNAVKNNRGAVQINGRMIDPPVVERALKLVG
ncbi:MAG: CoA ester lyase [Kangiellaceae bacterium]|jgi:citrate lyase subunit beta/citryl-CoA lyase|nr:CoA ester lyase [Kangiellaceae bacterium]